MGHTELLRVSGTPRECGRQIGESRRGKILNYLEACAEFPPQGMTWNEAVDSARPYAEATKKHFPDVFAQNLGLAEGAGVAVEQIIAAQTEELWQNRKYPQAKACTDLAVRPPATNGEFLVAHNNDLGPEDEVEMWEMNLSGGLSIFCIGLAGLYPSVGISSAGICETGNEVTPTDNKIGVPRGIIAMAILYARNMKEAIDTATHPNRASSYNIVLTTSREIVNIEGSATTYEKYGPDNRGVLTHANQYTRAGMKKYEGRPVYPSSALRQVRAEELAISRRPIYEKDLEEFLRDHDNGPSDNSICRHGEESATRFGIIANMTTGRVTAAMGQPCTTEFTQVWQVPIDKEFESMPF